jgi:hypothetical protein
MGICRDAEKTCFKSGGKFIKQSESNYVSQKRIKQPLFLLSVVFRGIIVDISNPQSRLWLESSHSFPAQSRGSDPVF